MIEWSHKFNGRPIFPIFFAHFGVKIKSSPHTFRDQMNIYHFINSYLYNLTKI